MSTVRIYHGDCLDVLATLPAASIDACVTDPPYELGFMGQHWDRSGIAFRPALWSAIGRVLKPGAHLLACGGTRTSHRMVCAIEDAGFEIRDSVAWLYGSGFPKSLNLGDGLGTALKPAHEPIVLARKPFRGSVAANVQQHGTGALNIDACRIEGDKRNPGFISTGPSQRGGTWSDDMCGLSERMNGDNLGRWPANVCLDERAALVLDEQSGELISSVRESEDRDDLGVTWSLGRSGVTPRGHDDSGGASRFFYVAKPSRDERDQGCDGLDGRTPGACTDRADGSDGLNSPRAGAGRTGGGRNYHPTVKPIELMRWLVKLITPIDGTVIDPFLGSGTTGMACRYELRHFIGIEREAEYIAIAERRIASVTPLFAEPAQVKEADDATPLVGSLLDLA